MIGEQLLRFAKNQKYFVLDTETEGLNLAFSRPWQVSATAYVGKEMTEELDLFPWFADLQVSKQAALITGFNWDEYKRKAIPPLEVYNRINPYLQNPDYIIIWHNGLPFDSMIWAILCRAAGMPVDYSYLERSIDTNQCAKMIKRGFKPDRSTLPAFLAQQIKLTGFFERGLKTNLTSMGKEFGIDFDYSTMHIGANDVKCNKLVFNEMLWKLEL